MRQALRPFYCQKKGELGAEATVKKFLTVVGKETGKFAGNWIEGEYGVIEFREPGISGMNLKLGPKVKKMTDRQILNEFNKTVRTMEEMRKNYLHRPVEISPGKPQFKCFEAGDQWVPRGDVLRCVIEDGGPDCEATVWIDDQELSLRQFGRLLVTHAGWGMRIVFVPGDEIDAIHPREIREPEDELTQWTQL